MQVMMRGLKRRSHVERKRKQNKISTRISVSQDGVNLGPRIVVTLDQQLGNEDFGNEIKDRRHLGLNLNRGGIERVFFILRLRLPLRCPDSHV